MVEHGCNYLYVYSNHFANEFFQLHVSGVHVTIKKIPFRCDTVQVRAEKGYLFEFFPCAE